MTKINETTELPDWFELTKYKEAKNLDAAGWFIQLSLRKELYDLYEMIEKEGQDESTFFTVRGGAILHEIVRQNLERLRAQPIQTDPIQPDTFENLYASCRGSDYKEDLSIKPVRGLSLQDLTAQRLSDRWEASKGNGNVCQANRWELLTVSELGDCPTEPILVGSLGQNGFAAFVDLNATDSVLKKAFALWLKESRRNQLGNPHKQSKFYDRWASSGLLPYLDLRIWAMERKLHIPGRVMSKAIKKNDTGVENLRKTLIPIATSLMNDLSELQALAAVESAT